MNKLIPSIKENEAYVARKGHGKTTLARNALYEIDRSIILDTNFEHDFTKLKGNIGVAENLDSFKKQVQSIKQKKYPQYTLITRFERLDEYELDYFFDLAYWLGDHRLHIEEAQNYAHSKYIPDNLLKIVTRNRHAANRVGMSYSFTTVSPSLIPRIMYESLDKLYVGDLQSKNARKYFDDIFDDVDQFKNQPLHQFQVYDLNKNSYTKISNDLTILDQEKKGAKNESTMEQTE